MISKSKACVRTGSVDRLREGFVFNALKIIRRTINLLISLMLKLKKKFNWFLKNLRKIMLIEWIKLPYNVRSNNISWMLK